MDVLTEKPFLDWCGWHITTEISEQLQIQFNIWDKCRNIFGTKENNRRFSLWACATETLWQKGGCVWWLHLACPRWRAKKMLFHIWTESQKTKDAHKEGKKKLFILFYDLICLNEKKKCKQITTKHFSHLHIFYVFLCPRIICFSHTEFLREVYI